MIQTNALHEEADRPIWTFGGSLGGSEQAATEQQVLWRRNSKLLPISTDRFVQMSREREVVLVTGGSGLVGRCLADELSRTSGQSSREFVFLSSEHVDLTQAHRAREIFEQYKPDHVIHLAAKVGGLFANLADDKNQFYELNCKINENVLSLSFEFNVKRCISCLSTCVFPNAIELPLDETKIHAGPPHESNYGYAMAKRQVDLLNRHYNSRRQTDERTGSHSGLFFSIVPTNIYGPHDNFDLSQSHVVPGLVRRAFETVVKSEEDFNMRQDMQLVVCGSGRPLRQFVYGPDLAKLILWALDEFGDEREPLVIMSPDEGAEVSIGQVAQLICAIFNERFGVNLKVCLDQSKSDGQLRKTASNRKLRQLNPAFKFAPLETGLHKTIDWFCSHYPNVRGCRE